MHCHKVVFYLTFVVALAAAPCFGGETNKEPESVAAHFSYQSENVVLKAWVEPGEFSGELQLRRLYLNADTNRFGFMLAPGLIMNTPTKDKVTLASPQFEFFLTIQIIAPDSFTYSDAACRTILEQRFPDSIMLEESQVDALNRQGSLFKLHWKSPENVNRSVAAAFVPTPAGVLEIVLVANPSKAAEGQDVIMDLLRRGRSNESGRLNMPIYRPLGYN